MSGDGDPEEQPESAEPEESKGPDFDDEIIAELRGVLQELVDEGHLELASRRGPKFLAGPLFSRLDRNREANIADWLVDRNEVSELYLDEDELREHFRSVLSRMEGKKQPPVRMHPELIAAIMNAPDDAQARSVYADWLLEQGDPRGELIAIQIQRGAAPNDARLAEKEETLLARYRHHFYGDLALSLRSDAIDRVEITHKNGFFDAVSLFNAEQLETLLALESSRFLRTLRVECLSLDAVDALMAKTSWPKTLVSLELVGGKGYDLTRGGRIDLGRATRGLARLERLVVRANDIAVTAPLETPKLRHLEIEAEVVRFDSTDVSFGAMELLERLELVARKIQGVKHLHSMFAKPPPALSALSIRKLTPALSAHTLLKALLASPLASKLRTLDLRTCELRDRDAELLLAHRQDLKKLETLLLRGNSFLPTVRGNIEAIWPNCFSYGVNDENDEDDDDRYEDTDE